MQRSGWHGSKRIIACSNCDTEKQVTMESEGETGVIINYWVTSHPLTS